MNASVIHKMLLPHLWVPVSAAADVFSMTPGEVAGLRRLAGFDGTPPEDVPHSAAYARVALVMMVLKSRRTARLFRDHPAYVKGGCRRAPPLTASAPRPVVHT